MWVKCIWDINAVILGEIPMVIKYILSAVIAYFLGSISFAILITKGILKKDVRTMGSGNAGATNVARVFGMGIGFATFAGDILKTVAAMSIGKAIGGEIGFALAGAFCLLGHSWPIYYNFRGGKGVSVGVASVAMIDLRLFCILAVVFFTVFFISRRVSLCSVTVAILLPIILLILGDVGIYRVILGFFLGAMVVFLHRGNIKRLLNGTEPKFSAKSAGNVSADEYGGKK